MLRFTDHSGSQAITLKKGKQTISLVGLKAALLFIDAQQKRVGSETAWIDKGNDPPLSVPPAPALKGVAIVNPTPTPLSYDERNDLLDYGNWRMNSIHCSLDPMRREVRVAALTDDKALLMIGCEAGAYNTVDLAWIVSRKKPFASRAVRLRLPFNSGAESNDMELMNAVFDEKSRELITLAKGVGWPIAVSRRAGVLTASVFVWCVMPKSQAAITGMGQMHGPRCGSHVRGARWR